MIADRNHHLTEMQSAILRRSKSFAKDQAQTIENILLPRISGAAKPQPKRKQTAAAQSAQRKHRDLGHGKTRADCTSCCCPEGRPAARGAKARAIHSPALRRQQNPRSSAFFRVPISSVRSVKLRLGDEKILSQRARI